jgi:hypothetical protein
MTMNLDQLIESGIDQAKRVLVGVQGAQLLRAFVIQFKDRPPTIIACPWSDTHERNATIAAMRMTFKAYREHIDSYLFWSEVWMASENPRHPTGLMPADRQDRKEGVLINAFDAKGGERTRFYEIMRGPDGVVTDLVKFDREPDQYGGDLHNLLKDD